MISGIMKNTMHIIALCLLLLQPLFSFSAQEKAEGSEAGSTAEEEGPLTLEDELEQAGAPYTPGRMPVWEK